MIDALRRTFAAHANDDALVWRDEVWSYARLLERLDHWRTRLTEADVARGTVVALEADFSPDGVALFLALIDHACIIVPITTAGSQLATWLTIAQAEVRCTSDGAVMHIATTGVRADHAHYQTLRARQHPGLVIFSSGSTGTSKAAVHDLRPILDRFSAPRRAHRAIAFLVYDHIGGVNTLLTLVSSGGCLVTVADRSPDTVLAAVERHRVDLLPVTPTFLRLMILSDAWRQHDLSSLRTISYGTEPMPESVLAQVHARFPQIRLQQMYGLSETGILRTQSQAPDSTWIALKGPGFETRVVDGLLQIKAASAMLGYLNAPSPFTEDGWLRTGDAVEVNGEFLRILGRRSELINVGGEKVYPSEVESVLLTMPGVLDATVVGDAHPITGQIVTARVNLAEPEAPDVFKRRMRLFCRERLAPYKIPVKVTVLDEAQYSARFKKTRVVAASQEAS